MFLSGQKLWAHVFMQDEPEASGSGTTSASGKTNGNDNGDDPIKLLTALQGEREKSASFKKQADDNQARIADLEKELGKVKAIDPTKYQQMLDSQRAIEEEAQIKNREWGELKNRYGEEAKVLKGENNSLKEKMSRMEIRDQLGHAFRATGGLESIPVPEGAEQVDPLNLLISYLGDRVKLIDGKSVLHDNYGREEKNAEGKPKTLSEKMLELKRGSLGNLFRAESNASGNDSRTTMTRTDGTQMIVYTVQQAAEGKADMEKVRKGQAMIVQ